MKEQKEIRRSFLFFTGASEWLEHPFVTERRQVMRKQICRFDVWRMRDFMASVFPTEGEITEQIFIAEKIIFKNR